MDFYRNQIALELSNHAVL